MNELSITIWIQDGDDFDKVGNYTVNTVPCIGELLVIDRAQNLRVTDVIYSINKKPIRIKHVNDGIFPIDLDMVDIYTKIDH